MEERDLKNQFATFQRQFPRSKDPHAGETSAQDFPWSFLRIGYRNLNNCLVLYNAFCVLLMVSYKSKVHHSHITQSNSVRLLTSYSWRGQLAGCLNYMIDPKGQASVLKMQEI